MKKTFGNPALGEGGSGYDLDAVRRHLIEPVGQAILFLLQVVLALEAHPELCRVTLLQKSDSIPNALPPDRLGDGQKRLHFPI